MLYAPSRATKNICDCEPLMGTSLDAIPFSGVAVWHVMEDPKVFRKLPVPSKSTLRYGTVPIT